MGARSGFFKNKKLPEFPCYQNNTNSKSEICSQMRIIAPSYISSFQCKWEDFILHKSLFGRRSNNVWRIFSVIGGCTPQIHQNYFPQGRAPQNSAKKNRYLWSKTISNLYLVLLVHLFTSLLNAKQFFPGPKWRTFWKEGRDSPKSRQHF